MIFTPEHVDKIFKGTKIQTRRLWQEGDEGITPHGRVLRNGRIKYAMGRKYSVQPGRGKKGVGYIVLTHIRLERIQDISYKDCVAEGIEPHQGSEVEAATRFKFGMLWNAINREKGTRWTDNPFVWVLTFRPVGGKQ